LARLNHNKIVGNQVLGANKSNRVDDNDRKTAGFMVGMAEQCKVIKVIEQGIVDSLDGGDFGKRFGLVADKGDVAKKLRTL
jgi:hypothetical protein